MLAGSVRCLGLLQRGRGRVSELGLGSAPLSKKDFQAEGKMLHNQGWFSHWVGNGAKLKAFGAQGIVLGFSVLSLPIKLFPFLSLPAVPKTPTQGGCWSVGLWHQLLYGEGEFGRCSFPLHQHHPICTKPAEASDTKVQGNIFGFLQENCRIPTNSKEKKINKVG